MTLLAAGVGEAGFPSWHTHWDVWLLIGVLATGYWWATRVARPTPRQRGAFVAGLLTIWVASDWPVHDLAENYLYSVHMVQHMLLTLVAPPLLLIGTPAPLARRLLQPVWGFAKWVTR